MTSTPPREQTATIAALLKAAGRKKPEAPIRRTFLQQGGQRTPQPGPLREIVRRHDTAALDLYLLHRATASADPWDVTRDARTWARAIGHGTDRDSGVSIVSKTWRRLDETYNLVSRERSGRLAKITSLDESGDRSPYTAPTNEYFKLPFAYWTSEDCWYDQLSLPAKATLLIALSLGPKFVLPAERADDWYGISPDTIDRGQRELRHHHLLSRSFEVSEDFLQGDFKRTDFYFRLQAPFKKKRPPVTKGHLSAVGE